MWTARPERLGPRRRASVRGMRRASPMFTGTPRHILRGTEEAATMDTAMPETMKAAAIDRFGGPEVFRVRSLSVPKPKPNQVLIRLRAVKKGGRVAYPNGVEPEPRAPKGVKLIASRPCACSARTRLWGSACSSPAGWRWRWWSRPGTSHRRTAPGAAPDAPNGRSRHDSAPGSARRTVPYG